MFLLVLIAIMSHYNKFILKHDQTKLRNDKIYFQNSRKSLGILAFNIIQDHEFILIEEKSRNSE
jgi:REP element-mobilizing transposase RayT